MTRPWLAAVILGMTASLVVWFGTVGIVLAGGLVVLGVVASPRSTTGSGVLVGAGTGSIAIMLQAASRCPAVLGRWSPDCEGPDLTGALVAGVALVVLGSALMLTQAVGRSRRRRSPAR